MPRFAPLARLAAALTLPLIVPTALSAQTFAAITGTDAVISAHPTEAQVMQPGRHARAEAPLLYGKVRDGVYTVDGMVAKLRLNYDVNGAHYLYLFVPGIGTAVLSLTADPDSVATTAQLHNNELSFAAGDHRFQLTGVALSDGKNAVPEKLYVHLDREAWHLNRQPMVGFGNVAQMPYAWPGALATVASTEESHVVPPVPVVLLPSTAAVRPHVNPVAAAGAQGVSLR